MPLAPRTGVRMPGWRYRSSASLSEGVGAASSDGDAAAAARCRLIEGTSEVDVVSGGVGRLRTGGGERRRGEMGHRGLSRGCSGFWGPDARMVEASDVVGSKVGIVAEERAPSFCVAGVGMLVRLRDGLVSCWLFLRDRVAGVAEADVADCCADVFGNVDKEAVGAGDGRIAAPVDAAAAVATFMALCDRAEGRAGEVSRDANGDALADVAADVDCDACGVCFVDCARSGLRIDAEDDSRASVGCGLCAWLAGAPFTVLGDLSIFG